jgi:acetolactate synthase-1/2/3 large subunit
MAEGDKGQATAPLTGGRLLVAVLRGQGVERIFCVPGESFLTVLDALHDAPGVSVVGARHEGAAANMAEADGKLTGRPGICFVTRGPGAAHAAVGVHTAFQDSTPMVLFIGQVATHERDREGFQEVDFRAMFAPLAKWAAEIDDAARIPEYVARAFRTAMSGRAGPVVLSLPENVLSAAVATPAPLARTEPAIAAPRIEDVRKVAALLGAAERPLLVVGGGGWTPAGRAALAELAARHDLPVVASFRRQDILDNRHDAYCGHLGLGVDPSLAERLRAADLVVALGSRLGENTTGGYGLLVPPAPAQALAHVHPDPEELGRVYQPQVAIACGPAEFCEALRDLPIPRNALRGAWRRDARAAYLSFSTPPAPQAGLVDMARVVGWLSETLPPDAIVANGAGNYAIWLHRFFRYRAPHTELAPTSGAMGYGVPAAIAAKLRYPERSVVAFAGDGCFLMYPQELATAVQHQANLVVLVVDNGMYGTIRMHQERRFPGRVTATELRNPDFVALAQSFGAYGERVEATADFPDAFRRAAAAGRPAVLHLRIDPAQLTPTLRLPA